MIRSIHHVAVLTNDIETAIQHYVKLMGCVAKEPASVNKPGIKWRTVLLPVGDGTTCIQLIEPHEGPGCEELKRGGEGTLFEIGFKCEDIKEFGAHLASHNIRPADLATQPLSEAYMQSSFGNRYFVIPPSASRGTRLEIVQFMEKPDRKS